ncbi:zonadhesin [Rhipicephalus sanguineus]|uniref:zonadhesin n=1 Tax=Rhipicephalus sanguineus TaxID=34632 RepID=UPI0018943A39|nr:zonadhesin [Rhipicephalus sanguineus]
MAVQLISQAVSIRGPIILFIAAIAVSAQYTGINHKCNSLEVPVLDGIPRTDLFCKPELASFAELYKRRYCLCKAGYIRNAWGQCIRLEECYGCHFTANADFSPCSSACPHICGLPTPANCTKQCVSGCACAPGFVRTFPNGPCISLTLCMQSCLGPHQMYTTCSPLCPLTCENPDPRWCPPACGGYRCVCQPGYVALTHVPLVCIPPDQCPDHNVTCSGPHQRYTTCKSRCPVTCFDNRRRPCTTQCGGQGCVCRKGYVQLQADPLVCVRRQECPPRPRCPSHGQAYTTCLSRCPETCSDAKPRLCPAVCAGEGCACDKGFVQLQADPLICVRKKECPSHPRQCLGANQVFTDCKSRCPATCSESEPRVCPAGCAGHGCVCKKGYVQLRALPLICVRRKYCPTMPKVCPASNQEYTSCKSTCPLTCTQKLPRMCTSKCAGEGCVCKQGYVQLREEPLLCVPPDECPSKQGVF